MLETLFVASIDASRRPRSKLSWLVLSPGAPKDTPDELMLQEHISGCALNGLEQDALHCLTVEGFDCAHTAY